MQHNTMAETLWLAIDATIIAAVANCVSPLVNAHLGSTNLALVVIGAIVTSVAAIAMPGIPTHPRKLRDSKLKICYRAVAALKVFWWSAAFSVVMQTVLAFRLIPSDWKLWICGAASCFLVESLLFWRGMIAAYVSSVQLGVKTRAMGMICGWIPVVNLVILLKIIHILDTETVVEEAKERLDASREDERICATKYPILLVHGVFFRDSDVFDYWGRIPDELRHNGATIYYGNHQSAASVRDSARELTERIRDIVGMSGCGKVNVIAHSKGGLDMRYAIARCGAAPYVASLTTINTPHRGCGFADYLLSKASPLTRHRVASAYNAAAERLGDPHPDFLAAVRDLTQAGCSNLNAEMLAEPFPAAQTVRGVPNNGMTSGMSANTDDGVDDGTDTGSALAEPVNNGQFAGIICHSVGSCLGHAAGGRFPLNFTHSLVKWFDGPNDGLVAKSSFPWGDRFTWLEPKGKRGISHADMIDLNRENIPGFDVREFYVQLVAELKQWEL